LVAWFDTRICTLNKTIGSKRSVSLFPCFSRGLLPPPFPSLWSRLQASGRVRLDGCVPFLTFFCPFLSFISLLLVGQPCQFGRVWYGDCEPLDLDIMAFRAAGFLHDSPWALHPHDLAGVYLSLSERWAFPRHITV
jgi:hypothetical protein